MKKTLLLVMCLAASIAVQARTIYLSPNANWKQAGARFAVYAFGNGETWYGMTSVKGVYRATIDDKYTKVIFCRMNPGIEENGWDGKWNQTTDLDVPTDGKDLYTVAEDTWDNGGGAWSTYVAPAPEDPTAKFYITGKGEALGAWNPKAIKSETDTYTLNLAAGTYNMKITLDGTWDTALGFDALTEKADGLAKDEDGNITFTLTEEGAVKVTYTALVFKLEGAFYVKPVDKTVVYLVPSEEWMTADAKFAAWIWGEKIEAQWTAFFAPLAADNDTLKVTINPQADSIAFVRFSPKTATPTWEHKEGTETLIWGETKSLIDYTSMVWTVIGWDKGQWTPVSRPCEKYGLMVDGEYIAGKKNVLQTEWTEYYLRNVELKKGQKIKICNKCNDTEWVINKFAATSYEFAVKDGAYVVEEDGKYDFYIKFIFENDEVYVSKQGTYTTAVRDQCTDVMMQAFYNESYDDDAPGVSATKDYKLGLGNTRWATLLPQAEEIGHYIDLIWLPPSANGDGMGYHPRNYSDQNSNWGTRAELEALIAAFHNAGAKVIADIVINHCTGNTSWCDFPTFDFGEIAEGGYGVFHPDASYICKNDEVNAEWNKTAADTCWGSASGSYDDGENWDGARDWAHNDVKVQEMFIAYLKWMRNVMKYDGFRYDKGDGFNNWHHSNYNKKAGPYIAFMESYNGDDRIIEEIQGAEYNLMALDFQTKWQAFDAIAGFDYSKCAGSGLLGRGYSKYAITFIDSHDWFLRPDNENEFAGRGNSLKPELKDRLLQANAFLLSMPGVPCIFYPHWAKYKEELKPMIEARKLAGVHSESPVTGEQAEHDGYQCTLQGKDGWLILQLGNKTNHTGWGDAAYKLVAKGNGYAVWVNRTTPMPTGIDEVQQGDVQGIKCEKFMQNGKLYIRLGERVYDAQGLLLR